MYAYVCEYVRIYVYVYAYVCEYVRMYNLQGMHAVVLFYKITFKIVPVSTQQSSISLTLHRAIMSLLVLWYYTELHISAPKAIIRPYNLSNIFKLLNFALYMVSYNLNTY
jgi:hypothetical protein